MSAACCASGSNHSSYIVCHLFPSRGRDDGLMQQQGWWQCQWKMFNCNTLVSVASRTLAPQGTGHYFPAPWSLHCWNLHCTLSLWRPGRPAVVLTVGLCGEGKGQKHHRASSSSHYPAQWLLPLLNYSLARESSYWESILTCLSSRLERLNYSDFSPTMARPMIQP